MLTELKIENVAVIEKACAGFTNGFNVLTGETGAGKSILIDSINAILGNRTSKDIVRTGAAKACIWATFSNLPSVTKNQLSQAGYDADDELLLYREITQDGKSTCRINGMPANASVVRDICDSLINIHGQHDNQSLMNPLKHMSVLDSFAQNQKEHEKYYAIFKELVALRKEIKALGLDETEKERKLQELRFNIDEIESASLKIGEEEALITSKTRIKNSQAIITALRRAYTALNGTDENAGACVLLGDSANSLEALNALTDTYSTVSEKLNEIYYSAKDLASDINDILQSSDFEDVDLDAIEERLDLYYRLKKKYNADTIHILEYLETSKIEFDNITFADEKLVELKEKQQVLFTKAKQAAEELTVSRLNAFERFQTDIVKALEFLNMPGIRFELMHTTGPLSSSGQDTVEFYISPNPGEAAKPLAKIASGGELSRIMLAIKSALADKDDIGTVIYDEIDTGVSGLAAGRIGEKLLQTSNGRQIICITHTAQIASLANSHLLIKKNIEKDKTYTEIIALEKDERIQELARIISGDKITDISLANAKEMLEKK